MDEALEFGLPGLAQRKSLLALYLDKYIRAAGTEQVRARGGVGDVPKGHQEVGLVFEGCGSRVKQEPQPPDVWEGARS
jgi:hypothetical protein